MQTVYEYGTELLIDIEQEFYYYCGEGYSVREAKRMIIDFIIDNQIATSCIDIEDYLNNISDFNG